ncbi:methyltransferase [Streptomyces spectabilis]|uniref:methyltransferase n=1 Tax=Streptomyces spectabilis TaxID=68270 RepID=UPI0033F672DC
MDRLDQTSTSLIPALAVREESLTEKGFIMHASNPLVNPSGELTPAHLMRLVSGFWAAKTLAAAVELDLFSHFARAGGATQSQAARLLRLEPRATDILLSACAGLGLLSKDGEVYHNTELSDRFLVRGHPYYFGGFVRMIDVRNYPAWLRVAEALRSNRPVTWDPSEQSSIFVGEDPVLLDTFWEGMYCLSITTARVFAECVPLEQSRRLLDVGGGGGAYTIELCRRYPDLHTAVYDLPLVSDITMKKVKKAGLTDRIKMIPGDFFSDPALPTGYDTLLLSMVLHDWSEAECQTIIGKCRAALPPGGTLAITELFVDDDKSGPLDATLMGMNMLVETIGRNYTRAEYRRWLDKAGFAEVTAIDFNAPATNGALLARVD